LSWADHSVMRRPRSDTKKAGVAGAGRMAFLLVTQLVLTAEHRAASNPEPLSLALVGENGNMHLAPLADRPSTAERGSAPDDLDAAILETLDGKGQGGLPRTALRALLRVRNGSLGEALARLAQTGQIARQQHNWIRIPVPVPAHLRAHRNGNARTP